MIKYILFLMLTTGNAYAGRVIMEGLPATRNTIYVDTVTARVGISTGSPTYALDVNGTMRVSSTTSFQTIMSTSVCIGGVCNTSWPEGGTGGVSTTTVWVDNLGSMAFGPNAKTPAALYNTFFGADAATYYTASGVRNVAVGQKAGWYLAAGTDNTIVGYHAGQNALNESYNAFFGSEVGQGGYTGTYNVGVGYRALYRAYGHYNTALGHNAGFENNGSRNVHLGAFAGQGVYNGSVYYNNIFIGYNAGLGMTYGDNNILMGYEAGKTLTTGDSNIIIGNAPTVPAVDVSSYMNVGNLITGIIGASSVTVQGSLYANAFYGDGANLTGLPAGGVTVSTFIASISMGGDVFVANTGFIPNTGAKWFIDNTTITITGVKCFTVYTSTVAATTFNIAVSSDTGNFNGWKYMFNSAISVAANAQASVGWTVPDSNALISYLPTTLSLHTTSVAASGTPAADYGCSIRYWRRLD